MVWSVRSGMKISPTSPRKKVISSEEIGANAFAQADMAVKERDASIVVTTPKKIFPLVRFLDLKAILSRRKGLCFTLYRYIIFSKFNLSFTIYHTFILLSSSIVKVSQK